MPHPPEVTFFGSQRLQAARAGAGRELKTSTNAETEGGRFVLLDSQALENCSPKTQTCKALAGLYIQSWGMNPHTEIPGGQDCEAAIGGQGSGTEAVLFMKTSYSSVNITSSKPGH